MSEKEEKQQLTDTEYREFLRNALIQAKDNPRNLQVLQDLTDILLLWEKNTGTKEAVKYAGNVLKMQNYAMSVAVEEKEIGRAEALRNLIFRTLLFSAPYNFDHYMQALEYDRQPWERFYLPRREVLFKHVQALQALADDKLDELFLSQPPRTGKTTLITFFITWIIGRNSELSNLYVSFSDTLTNSFFQGVLEVIQDPVTYHWADIFPTATIAGTNSKEETLNICRKKKYPSLTCRSLYGTLNGACDCRGFLIADDLLSGIEEALNPDRLETAWNHVDNNMLTRAKSTAKILWTGTRWSVSDPIGRRLDLLQSDRRFKERKFLSINIPALDENGKSNFNYKYRVGFSTTYYHERRASFERNNSLADWSAQYMGEPIEREGTLFTPDGFMYFNGDLPDREPDRIFMAVDPAFGGGDYVASPIAYQYGDREFYIVDVVYNNSAKNVTQPLLVSKARRWNVQSMQIEATKATQAFAKEVDEIVQQEEDYHVTITTKPAPTNTGKEARIFQRAPDIRQYFYFLDADHRTKEYEMFMQNVFSFKMAGKNKHDDAPDSLAMLYDMAFAPKPMQTRVFKRPF